MRTENYISTFENCVKFIRYYFCCFLSTEVITAFKVSCTKITSAIRINRNMYPSIINFNMSKYFSDRNSFILHITSFFRFPWPYWILPVS